MSLKDSVLKALAKDADDEQADRLCRNITCPTERCCDCPFNNGAALRKFLESPESFK